MADGYHDPNRNTHIWKVSLERAEAIWADIDAFKRREIGKDELKERLLRHGLPRNIDPGDHLRIQVVKRVQSNGAKPISSNPTRLQ